jgi:tetratricopeptide (TPR) repeat protein
MNQQLAITNNILGRPSWGRITLGPAGLKHRVDQMLSRALGLEARGGGLLLISHDESQEATVRLLLELLVSSLRSSQRAFNVYQPQLDGYLTPEAFDRPFLLVSNLPRCDGLLDLLQSGAPRGQVVIATGIKQEWEQLTISLPFVRYAPFGEVAQLEDNAAEARDADLAFNRANPELADAYLLAAAFDLWGVPLPFELLARALVRDEDRLGELIEEAQLHDYLFWIENIRPAELMVSTRSPSVARAAIVSICGDDTASALQQSYAKVLQAVEPTIKSERYIPLKLFQAILRASHYWTAHDWFIKQPHRRWLRTLIEENDSSIKAIIQQGDSIEALLWGKLFDELRLFKQSDDAFKASLGREPRNVYLLHARARMLGRWAHCERGKYEEAFSAFREAGHIAPDNTYVWHSWGVMEHNLGNYGVARSLLRDALSRGRLPSEKLYSLLAWADLELEARDGDHQRAEGLLGEAEEIAPDELFILLTRAKLAFYEGRYSASAEGALMSAEWHLQQALSLNPSNIVALHMSGNIAMKRGHWKDAEEWFSRALKVDPESVESLHSMAELEGERAERWLSDGDLERSFRHNHQSQKRFQELKTELGNSDIRTLVAFAVCLARRVRIESRRGHRDAVDENFEESQHLLEKALYIDPLNRWALHSLGRLLFWIGRATEAEPLFGRILRTDPKNLASLTALGELSIEAGREDEARQMAERVERAALSLSNRPVHEVIRALNSCVDLYLKLGDFDNALRVSESALGRDRENAYTLRSMARVLQELGRADEARKQSDEAKRLAGE